MEPLFLGLDEVIALHRDQLERYGGSPGIREIGLLRSAVAMPAAGVGEEHFHGDLFEMAAACLFHIVQNHPFVDGNKRTGAAAALVFLLLNGVDLRADEESFEALVRSVAEGPASKSVVAEYFRTHGSD